MKLKAPPFDIKGTFEPKIEKIGNRKTGYLEFPVYGYLTNAEGYLLDQVLEQLKERDPEVSEKPISVVAATYPRELAAIPVMTRLGRRVGDPDFSKVFRGVMEELEGWPHFLVIRIAEFFGREILDNFNAYLGAEGDQDREEGETPNA